MSNDDSIINVGNLLLAGGWARKKVFGTCLSFVVERVEDLGNCLVDSGLPLHS